MNQSHGAGGRLSAYRPGDESEISTAAATRLKNAGAPMPWPRGAVMPRKAKELSPLEVRRLLSPGRWSVGGVAGLALQVTASGAGSWVLRLAVSGQQREMGLGSFPTVTLAIAREKARAFREQVATGADPIASRHATASATAAERLAQKTFAEVAAHYIAQHGVSWKKQKHHSQWTSTLQTYAQPVIGLLLVRDITAAHVILVLEPIWASKTETATCVRSRIELVLEFASARDLREGLNLARWRGNLDAAFAKASKVSKVEHHAAVTVDAVAAFMRQLQAQAGMGARALERRPDRRTLRRSSWCHVVGNRL
jgi:Arm DNA-binding domain